MTAPFAFDPGTLTPDLVRASAGTGKTQRIADRYLTLVLAGESPDRILATTFTRKAAGEIRGRVFTRLLAACRSADGASRLGDALGLPGLSTARCRTALRALASGQHRLLVTTLDGFFAKIASAFSPELGVMPGWKIADPGEERAMQEEALMSVFADPEGAAALDAYLAGRSKRGVFEDVRGLIPSLLRVYLDSDPGAWRAGGEGGGGPSPAEISALAEAPIPVTKAGTPNKRYVEAVRVAVRSLRAGDWASFLGLNIVRAAEEGDDFAAAEMPAALADALTAVVPAVVRASLDVYRRETAAVAGLLELFAPRYLKLKTVRQRVGYDDVKSLLGRSALLGELDDVYFRLDARISHLLLDEFQDTAPDEWRVLLPFADELLSKADGERSWLCVGDTKQSIYGWRGADPLIFDGLPDLWPQLNVVPLSVCRRCAGPVIAFVNRVFSALPEHLTPAGGFPEHSTSNDGPGHVTFETVEEKDDVFAAVAARVKALVDAAPAAEAAVLVRTNAEVARAAAALGRVGVAASEEGRSALHEGPAAAAFLSLLTLVDHPGHSIARFHVASTPLGAVVGLAPVDEARGVYAVSDSLARQISSLGFGATLAGLRRKVAEWCDARDLGDLDALVAFGYATDRDRPCRASEFVAAARLASPERRGGSKVRVMTVHAAKGLEFDAVFLPLGDRAIGDEPMPSAILASRPDPLSPYSLVIRRPPASVVSRDPGLAAAERRARAARERDDVSALYVALTRARSALHVYRARPAARSEKAKNGPAATPASVVAAAAGGDYFEEGDAGWRRVLPGAAPAPEGAGESPVTLRPGAAVRRRALPAVTPTGEADDGIRVDLSSLFGTDERATRLGDAVHRILGRVAWADGTVPGPGHGEPPDDPAAVGIVAAALASPSVAHLFDRSRYPGLVDLWRERRYAVRKEGVVTTGCFDRVVVERAPGGGVRAHVVDWKTDDVPAEAAETRAAAYRDQLAAYRSAAARLLGTSEEAVATSVVFVRPGVVVGVRAGAATRSITVRTT